MSDKGAIWTELQRVLSWWAKEADRDDLTHKRTLHDAVLAYADAVRGTAKPKPTGVTDHRDDALTLPFGRSRGRTVAEAATDDLRWILPKIQESIDDPAKARWRESNVALAAAIEAELEER